MGGNLGDNKSVWAKCHNEHNMDFKIIATGGPVPGVSGQRPPSHVESLTH